MMRGRPPGGDRRRRRGAATGALLCVGASLALTNGVKGQSVDLAGPLAPPDVPRVASSEPAAGSLSVFTASPLALGHLASLNAAPPNVPLQEADTSSGWRKGALIGGLAGAAVGLLAHALVDRVPCDSCAEGGSAAEGARLEFVALFAIAGSAVGALLGR